MIKRGDTVKWAYSSQILTGTVLTIAYDSGNGDLIYFIKWHNHEHKQWHRDVEVILVETPDDIFKELIKK